MKVAFLERPAIGAIALALVVLASSRIDAQGTAFTYQVSLDDAGAAVDTDFDFCVMGPR